MNIVFMGTPPAAAVSLERLIRDGHRVVAVYTQPDRPSGRGRKVVLSAVKELALRDGLKVLQPDRIKSPVATREFRSLGADVVVVVAYGRILPPAFLETFRYGSLNVHFSLLPKYRGAAPVNWAIANGETITGVTVMQMNAGLDSGDILLQRSVGIGENETAPELLGRLSLIGAELISEALASIDVLKPAPQDDQKATFAPMLHREDGLIDWSRPAIELSRRVRAFQPFPSSYIFYGGQKLTIWATRAFNASPSQVRPGTVIAAQQDRLEVKCGGDSSLLIDEIQPAGKRRMPIRDFLNGADIHPGTAFSSSLGSHNN